MEFKRILLEVKEGIAVITLNDPERLNPLDINAEIEIEEACKEVEKRNEIKAAIITGAGQKAFSAGADIKSYLEMDLIQSIGYIKKIHEALWTVEHLRKPTIAAINGLALGGGLELALACSLRFASENARLGLPEINVGVIPGNGGIQRLARLIGKGRAMWFILTGEFISAQEALQWGVVNKVFPLPDLMDACMDFLKNNLLKKSPTSVWAVIKSLNCGLETDLKTACEMDLHLSSICMGTEDFKEGVKAFVEKRKPNFQGK
ncbi:MAG: enoyl-CoA hydratase/isomerase family protein [Syntrophales bacterium]|nr:enoyl-CoA hydratase/isomerase family protein [Syntrophales bacterium]